MQGTAAHSVDLAASERAVKSIISRVSEQTPVPVRLVIADYRLMYPDSSIDDATLEAIIIRASTGQARPVEFGLVA